MEFFGVLSRVPWGRCRGSFAEDQRGNVRSRTCRGAFLSVLRQSGSSRPEPGLIIPRLLLSAEAAAVSSYENSLNLLPALVSPNLSTSVLPSQLLNLLLPWQFHKQSCVVKSRVTSLKTSVLIASICAVGKPRKAIHKRVRPRHLAVCPRTVAMTRRNTAEGRLTGTT